MPDQEETAKEVPRIVKVHFQEDESNDNNPNSALTLEQRAAKRARAEVKEEEEIYVETPINKDTP